ncbi:unnamed protein product [Mytilus edulis]|uniref:Uncharacterized protein n=1 Tax=Mytilus edulis TaxID=6550 RepID=A0A8S3SQN1_MYTED|nr:unnamed protein product [Mytilus edulis]
MGKQFIRSGSTQWGYLYKSLPLDNSLNMEKQRAKIEELKNQLFYKTDCKEEAQKEKDREDTLVEHKYNEMYVHTKHAKEKESSFLSHHMHEHRHVIKAYDDILEEFYTLVEKNGALMTRIWAPKYQIQQVICYRLAVYILDKFKADEEFLKTFVQKCLPRACSSLCSDSILGQTVNKVQEVNSRIASTVLLNISEIISAVVDNANIEHRIIQSRRFSEYFDETCLKNVGSVFSVLTASDIFRDILDERMSAEKYTTKIMKVISPFIYGKTPLFKHSI